MQNERKLAVPPGYDTAKNPRMASFAAQLDDLLGLLKEDCAGLEVRHLEWQPHPGMNTVGMLLAHLAVVDVWWIRIAPFNLDPDTDGDRVNMEVIGMHMDDDGLPCPADGGHPKTLTGKTLAQYLELLDKARAESHRQMRTWTDAQLHTSYTLRNKQITYEWTLYHVLEHFAGHYYQILMLKHMMRDANLLPKQEEK